MAKDIALYGTQILEVQRLISYINVAITYHLYLRA